MHHGQRPDQQRKGLFGLHTEGDRNQDGYGTGATEAGDQAHDQAGEHTHREHQEQGRIRQ